ncbi:hypothetical protein [Lentzea kentuckyensis]|uniref:hypothetical protein n=1 Tax=Lentzea kentuckyensis TaxID=360086 RepID=UPI001FEB2FF4|nr:hypothetical protein [Lentzea kentuckyensis]
MLDVPASNDEAQAGPIPAWEPELRSLIMTRPRAVIVGLLLPDSECGPPRKLTSAEITAESGLGPTTVTANMRPLAASGWFGLCWQEGLDPYDFANLEVRRQIFVREELREALSLRLRDFKEKTRHEPNRQIEYAAPHVGVGGVLRDHVELWSGGHLPKYRREILLYCLKDPTRCYEAKEFVGVTALGINSARHRLIQCEEAGLMVSKIKWFPEDRTRRRLFMLTESGLGVAKALAASPCGEGES